jgi:hypothetical protein
MNLLPKLLAFCATIGGVHQALDAQTIVRVTELAPAGTPELALPGRIVAPGHISPSPASAALEGVAVGVTVFPNPASEAISVEPILPTPDFLQGASLVNALGQVVESAIPHTSEQLIIGVGHLPRGAYQLVVFTTGGITTHMVSLI